MTPLAFLITFVVVTIAVVAVITFAPALTATRSGKTTAFLGLFVFPVLAGWFGFNQHMERSKKTSFCLSCHIMEPYGRSLLVDNKDWIPAAHYQNNRVPQDRACFTCHTNYTLYGDYNAKLRGLRHVWAQYVTGPKLPVRLYEPYNNRECLHCHRSARSFRENEVHNPVLEDLQSNSVSCLSCHTTIHNVQHLNEVKMWKPE